MLKKEMTRDEIERALQGKGDYVQIDSLRRLIKEGPAQDLRRFASLKLVEIYERRSMFPQAAELYNELASISGHQEKLDYLLKETENYIKSGFIDRADASMSKLLNEAKPIEKLNLVITVKSFYKRQAELYEKERRKSKAAEIYEKILNMSDISDFEKREANQKLMMIYKELGNVQKYLGLKDNA